jgi:hypothetical protein
MEDDTMTTKATHTPGPWKVMQYSRDVYANGRLLANVQGEAYQAHVNARLIAATPALYEALKVLVADMEAEYRDREGDMDHDGINRAKAALAQAEGK